MTEERWHSIDLVAEMLQAEFATHHADRYRLHEFRRAERTRLGAVAAVLGSGTSRNADRLVNRFWDYPRALRRTGRSFDLYHLVEQSYGQVVRALPADRTILSCHDLDTFRCVLDPARDPRPRWYRAMASWQMAGLRTAARVICDSHTVADELRAYAVVDPARIRVAWHGVAPAYLAVPDQVAMSEADRLLGPSRADRVDLLHVGSTVARKRIDVLLRVLHRVRQEDPRVRLVRVGGPLTPPQQALATMLGVQDAVVTLPHLERTTLAAVYHRAAIVLQPSEAEGFGLPVVEAMACGCVIVCSDLPVLREVGGVAVEFAPVGDADAWAARVLSLVREREGDPARWVGRVATSRAAGARFTWAESARQTSAIYDEVLAEQRVR